MPSRKSQESSLPFHLPIIPQREVPDLDGLPDAAGDMTDEVIDWLFEEQDVSVSYLEEVLQEFLNYHTGEITPAQVTHLLKIFRQHLQVIAKCKNILTKLQN